MDVSRPRFIVIGIMMLLLVVMHRAMAAEEAIGVRHMQAQSRERGRPIDVTVWYPAVAGGQTVVLGESPLFVGTSSRLNAPIRQGHYPVVLLSHGAGLAGRAEALSWFAAPLAGRGFIVVSPTHPRNTGPDRSAEDTMKLWLRPTDVSKALDSVEEDLDLEGHLARDQIGVVGLSMGGGTALALAGARFDPNKLAAYCDTDTRNPSLCGWVRQSKADLHALDMRDAARDNRDKRIRFAMAIDPAPVDVFDLGSLERIDIPVSIVNLGRPGQIPVTAMAADVARRIRSAHYAVIEDAGHFSMFGLCKPGAADLAEAEDIGDPICSDGSGTSRQAIHERLIDITAEALGHVLHSDR